MRTVRTPDDRFVGLPDFDFEPHYTEIDDTDGGTLRVHHLDEGPSDGPVLLLMHGEPTWSYLYRHMIPQLTAAGLRCIAPDLVGFGRSDKPTEVTDYTYARHVRWMSSLLFDDLDLRNITMFCQDWGGLIGLRLVAEQPDRFDMVIASNTGMPAGDGKVTDAFRAWQKFSREVESFDVGNLVRGGCAHPLEPGEIAAYDAPFPDDTYKAGARIFPSLMPMSPDDPASPDSQAAWKVLETFEKPFICAFSDKDPVTRGGDGPLLRRIPGTQGQPHRTIEDAAHFVQEDKPDELVAVILELTTPV